MLLLDDLPNWATITATTKATWIGWPKLPPKRFTALSLGINVVCILRLVLLACRWLPGGAQRSPSIVGGAFWGIKADAAKPSEAVP